MRSASNKLLLHRSWIRGSSLLCSRRREEANPDSSIPHEAPPPYFGGCVLRDCSHAFTLLELLVVLAVVALLATVALASQGSREHVLRTQCAGNLKQIGVGLNVYATEADDYLPLCRYRNVNPWYTYEAARILPGTTNIFLGYFNLGLLARSRAVSDAETLYCPAQISPSFTYDYYSTNPDVWLPPIGSGDDNLRTGYSYFPQQRSIEVAGAGLLLPRVTSGGSTRLEYGFDNVILAPVKLAEVNPQKSVVTDLVHAEAYLSHRVQGSVAGLNALFPDGNVGFQNARTRPENFDPGLWQNIGANGLNFRRAMNSWEQ